MSKIVYIDNRADRHECEVANGLSVMEGAVLNNVPGIPAICGGNCSCSTCHCYVAEAWRDVVGPPGPAESAVLELAKDRRPGSRLTCQIPVSDALDGLVVQVADNNP